MGLAGLIDLGLVIEGTNVGIQTTYTVPVMWQINASQDLARVLKFLDVCQIDKIEYQKESREEMGKWVITMRYLKG